MNQKKEKMRGEFKVSVDELRNRQSWDMMSKVKWFICRYIDFVESFGLNTYLAYSGGKDSDVMADIIDKVHSGYFDDLIAELEPIYQFLYKTLIKGNSPPPKCFCNTGLEFPEIVDHVKSTHPDAIFLKPAVGFTRFIKEFGVAVGSKKISMMIRRLKGYLENPEPKNEATRKLYLTGIKRDGTKSKSSKLPERWKPLLDAPFKVTDKCCDNFKKDPFSKYEKETGRKAIVGTTADESDQRLVSYLKTGCISFESGKERLRPMSIWLPKDVWEYSEIYGLRFCEVYYDRTDESGDIIEAENQTGCMFCLFGLHLEPKNKPNRIQRMAKSHPKQYEILMTKLGFSLILKWLDIPYKPVQQCGKQMSLFKNQIAP